MKQNKSSKKSVSTKEVIKAIQESSALAPAPSLPALVVPTPEEVTPPTTVETTTPIVVEAPAPAIVETPSKVMMVTDAGLVEVPTAPTPKAEKTEKKGKAVKPAPTAPVSKPKITNDELQIQIAAAHETHGVPKSFQAANQARLAALLTGTKASELVYDKATRDAAFMNSWMKWALSEYKKLAVKSK
jgi:hypothetical protein